MIHPLLMFVKYFLTKNIKFFMFDFAKSGLDNIIIQDFSSAIFGVKWLALDINSFNIVKFN